METQISVNVQCEKERDSGSARPRNQPQRSNLTKPRNPHGTSEISEVCARARSPHTELNMYVGNQPWHCVIINLLSVDIIHCWLWPFRAVFALIWLIVARGEKKGISCETSTRTHTNHTQTHERIERTRNVTSRALSHIVHALAASAYKVNREIIISLWNRRNKRKEKKEIIYSRTRRTGR